MNLNDLDFNATFFDVPSKFEPVRNQVRNSGVDQSRDRCRVSVRSVMFSRFVGVPSNKVRVIVVLTVVLTPATIPYIKGTSETIARILQPYNIRVAHKPITTLRQLLTNFKDKDEPNDRQGAVYKIKCCNCQATYIGETGRNLNTRLTEHKRATRNGDVNNNIAEHHLQTNHRIDWDSAECVIYSTDYYQRLTLESWFTNLEQTPLNRCQQLPAPYKRLINDTKTDKQ